VIGVASITKTFVTALVMRLAEEGRLSLDDALSDYLPDFPRAARITLRMLLAHRSGIHNYFESPRYARLALRDRDRRWTFEEILGFVGSPYCGPGRCYHYSNTNFVLLGRVAEVAGGAPLPRLLRREFLDSLDLDRTVFQPDEPTPADAAHGHLGGSSGFFDQTGRRDVIPHPAAVTVAWAAGAMASTPSDLARWSAALYGGEVLSAASVALMTDVAPPDAYGLGTRGRTFAGLRAVGHLGGIRGFESGMWYLPDWGVSVVVCSNRGLWLTDRVTRALVRTLRQAAG
jgi:D-alanyl-D-alanine carboxypeptidase